MLLTLLKKWLALGCARLLLRCTGRLLASVTAENAVAEAEGSDSDVNSPVPVKTTVPAVVARFTRRKVVQAMSKSKSIATRLRVAWRAKAAARDQELTESLAEVQSHCQNLAKRITPHSEDPVQRRQAPEDPSEPSWAARARERSRASQDAAGTSELSIDANDVVIEPPQFESEHKATEQPLRPEVRRPTVTKPDAKSVDDTVQALQASRTKVNVDRDLSPSRSTAADDAIATSLPAEEEPVAEIVRAARARMDEVLQRDTNGLLKTSAKTTRDELISGAVDASLAQQIPSQTNHNHDWPDLPVERSAPSGEISSTITDAWPTLPDDAVSEDLASPQNEATDNASQLRDLEREQRGEQWSA